MQTQSVGVDLHSKISLDKRDWKKTFIHPQSMGVDLPFFISLDKHNKKRRFSLRLDVLARVLTFQLAF